MAGMIVVHTKVRCRREHRDAFVAILRRFQDVTRSEPGCLAYAYTADLDDDCLFHGVERWRDAEVLRAHLGAPHMNDPESRFDDYSAGAEVVEVFSAEEFRL